MIHELKRIVIIGTGGHAKVVFDLCQKLDLQVAAFFDNVTPGRKEYLRHKVLTCWEALRNFQSLENISLIIAIGDNFIRKKILLQIQYEIPNANYATIIDPTAIISQLDTSIQEGTVIMPGAILNAGVKVGAHCLVNTGAQLDHDCVIRDFSSLGPGAICGGNVFIGEGSAVCLGAKIIEKITVGEWTIVGAGAMVISNIDNNKLAYGVPAKEQLEISPGKKYLK